MTFAFPIPIQLSTLYFLFVFGIDIFGAFSTLGYFMPKLKYWRPVFMMCDLKPNILYFVLGISEYGPFLAFSFTQGTVHYTSRERYLAKREKYINLLRL